MSSRLCIITGASASGKDHLAGQLRTHVANIAVEHHLNVDYHVVSADMFYKNLTYEQRLLAKKGEFNFDEPSAIDDHQLLDCVIQMMNPGNTEVRIPVYSFSECKRTGEQTVYMNPGARRVIVVQGIFPLCFPKLVDLCNLSVFLVTDPDVRITRRIQRDTVERGLNVEVVIKQYETWVKPGYEKYVAPMMSIADLPMQYNRTNHVVVEMLALQLLFGQQ